jgi:hypothetical protein
VAKFTLLIRSLRDLEFDNTALKLWVESIQPGMVSPVPSESAARRGTQKSPPNSMRSPLAAVRVARRKAPAASGNGRGHQEVLRFSARHPLRLEKGK